MAHEGGSKGLKSTKGKGEAIVKPGLVSGDIGGLKNPRKMTPDAGDKPSKNKKSDT